MVHRVFIDLECTGDGTSKFHDIIEIHAEIHRNGAKISSYSAQYKYTNRTVFSGGMNFAKAKKHKELNKKSSEEGLIEFIDWLNTNLGKNKAFFVSYNCNYDFRHVKN